MYGQFVIYLKIYGFIFPLPQGNCAHSGERSIWDDFMADQNGYLEAIINRCVAWKRLSPSGQHGNRSSSASVLKHRLVVPHSTSLHILSFCQRRCCFAQQKMAPSLSQHIHIS